MPINALKVLSEIINFNINCVFCVCHFYLGNTPLHLSVMLGRKGKPIQFYQSIYSVNDIVVSMNKRLTIQSNNKAEREKSAVVCSVYKNRVCEVKVIDIINVCSPDKKPSALPFKDPPFQNRMSDKLISKVFVFFYTCDT